jgi:hypothetical protein
MAKLKIFQNNDPTTNMPDPTGYRNAAVGVISNLVAFQNASDKERSDLLQTYASGHTIFQQSKDNDGTGKPIEVPISSSNCRVTLAYDDRIWPSSGVTVGEHRMALPKFGEALSVGYLDKYVAAIVSLYGGGGASGKQAACEFLFGLMLLTRCR